MKRIATLVLAVVLTVGARAQMPLGDGATASLITCGAGDDFYTTYGHTAIRIADTAADIDEVYNYGTFDFDTPHFYWRFTRGRLDYCLSREPYARFLAEYMGEGRAVWEQPLRLTPQEVQNLYVALEWNLQPENRYYRYDFFRDNCATRVRDMVEGALAHRTADYTSPNEGLTYRDYVCRPLRGSLEWWHLGIDILLGLRCDAPIDNAERMFLPLWMMEEYDVATVRDRHGSNVPLAEARHQWLTDSREPLGRSFPPVAVFCLLLAAVALLSVREGRSERLRRAGEVVDRVLFATAGAVSLFLIFMWVGTDHWCTKFNASLLWASPLYLLIAIFYRRSPLWALWLQLAMLLGAAVIFLMAGYSVALLPIVLMLALRTALMVVRRRGQK